MDKVSISTPVARPVSKSAGSGVQSNSIRNTTGSVESVNTPRDPNRESSNDKKDPEIEIRRKICRKYMHATDENAGKTTLEHDFDNLRVRARSPATHTPKFNSAELERAGRDLALPRYRSADTGSILPFILHVILSVKLMNMFYIYVILNGGWYFFIPLIVWTVVLVGPVTFLEISLGQFSSELSCSLFPRINGILIGVSYMMTLTRGLVVLYINTEHRYFSLLLEMLGEIIFKARSPICSQSGAPYCYTPDVCQKDTEVFYRGNCYTREDLVKNKSITAMGSIRLGVANMWKEMFAKFPQTKPIPDINRILNDVSYSHKIDAIFLLFLVCYVGSRLGVRKFQKCSKWFLMAFGTSLFAILVHLLVNDGSAGFPDLAQFFHAVDSDAKKLLCFDTWLNALTFALIAHCVGDGTLHAVGSMNPFNSNSQMLSIWVSIFAIGYIVFGTLLFGYMEIAGNSLFFIETDIEPVKARYMDRMLQLKRSVSFLSVFYHYSHNDSLAKALLAIFYIGAIIAQVANHILMSENFYITMLKMFPILTKVNARLLKHCMYAVYYLIMGSLYYVVQFGLQDHINESYHLIRILLVASVFWECVAVAKFYTMSRFLVNIRTMFGFSVKLYARIRTMTPMFYFLWTFFIPGICAVIFIGGLFRKRLTELDSALIVVLIVAFMPLFAAVRLLVMRWMRSESMRSFAHYSSGFAPIKITDRRDTNFDERAARITI